MSHTNSINQPGITALDAIAKIRLGCGQEGCERCLRKTLTSALARLNARSCLAANGRSFDEEAFGEVARLTAEAIHIATVIEVGELLDSIHYHHVGHA